MNYSISDEVPASWDSIISSFITVVEHDIQFNNGTAIDELNFDVKRGLLYITYLGGSKITDAFSMFAREMSSTICFDCNAQATRNVFTYPKCDDCL
jgi:hypothetical protein